MPSLGFGFEDFRELLKSFLTQPSLVEVFHTSLLHQRRIFRRKNDFSATFPAIIITVSFPLLQRYEGLVVSEVVCPYYHSNDWSSLLDVQSSEFDFGQPELDIACPSARHQVRSSLCCSRFISLKAKFPRFELGISVERSVEEERRVVWFSRGISAEYVYMRPSGHSKELRERLSALTGMRECSQQLRILQYPAVSSS